MKRLLITPVVVHIGKHFIVSSTTIFDRFPQFVENSYHSFIYLKIILHANVNIKHGKSLVYLFQFFFLFQPKRNWIEDNFINKKLILLSRNFVKNFFKSKYKVHQIIPALKFLLHYAFRLDYIIYDSCSECMFYVS